MLDELKQVIFEHRHRRNFFRLVVRSFKEDSDEFKLIVKAYFVARDQFFTVRRRDGTRYFYHKVAVAVIILAYLGIKDANLIVAALLHDLIEDRKGWTKRRIERMFNTDVAALVDAVTKPDRKLYGSDHKFETATFAKVRIAGYRAIVLKLADRLHNMITLWGTTEKKLLKTEETIDYVLPLARKVNRLWKELLLACTLHVGHDKEGDS